jgi:hypothetical protein
MVIRMLVEEEEVLVVMVLRREVLTKPVMEGLD